ncbi:MAG: Asp-tRNA(Asn)/Glu-tRNA(Gln) amidotransferase subunit GatC [Bacteroidota bacterium]|nr:Asp-tRNA(Asn)/Glu-tRNA(Gln) amidotransferase subunit GatC [Bacteroidota bacterium]
MKVNNKKIKRLAELAQLNLDENESKRLSSDLEHILAFVEKLGEVDTKEVQPLNHIHEASNIFDDDELRQIDIKEEALSNSSSSNSDYFKIKKGINTKNS